MRISVDEATKHALNGIDMMRFREYERYPSISWYYAEDRHYWLRLAQAEGYFVVEAGSPDSALGKFFDFLESTNAEA